MLTVIGLLLDIIGAWLLAYEIIWGYPKKDKALYAELRLKNILSGYKIQREISSSDEERKALDDRFKPIIKEEEKTIDIAGREHLEKSTRLALLGVVLLTVGFILQIIASV